MRGISHSIVRVLCRIVLEKVVSDQTVYCADPIKGLTF